MNERPARRQRIEAEQIGDVTVVNFVDRKIVDERQIQVIGEQLFHQVDGEGRCRIVLSFQDVEFFSSAALGKLITLNKKAVQAGGKLVMCDVNPAVLEVFEITKLDKFFAIAGDQRAALALIPLTPVQPQPDAGKDNEKT